MALSKLLKCFIPAVLGVWCVLYLDDRLTRWFNPFPEPSPAASGAAAARGGAGGAVQPGGPEAPAANGTLAAVALHPAPSASPARVLPAITRFKVILDPGHGGKGETRGAEKGDGWDPALGKFTMNYVDGAAVKVDGGTITEQEMTLKLARKVKVLLDLTADDRSWPRFEAIVHRYALGAKALLRRVRVDCGLTRDNSWQDLVGELGANVNRAFRLFDSPASQPATPSTPLYPGRLSSVNAAGADLVLCLHLNSNADKRVRNAASLFVAPFEFYELARQVSLGLKPRRALITSPYLAFWRGSGHGRRDEQALESAAEYFLDTKATKDEPERATYRRDRFQWRYRTPAGASRPSTMQGPFDGPFWDRERDKFEGYRRAGGPEDVGGDNLFAGQELVRFYRYALWKDHLAGGSCFPAPQPAKLTAQEVLGKHAPPLCAGWAISLYANSVVAYLELAHLTNERDLWLIENKMDVAAEGLAVGIYSLLAGLPVQPVAGIDLPRGRRIEWERYYDTPWGESYFAHARAVGRP